MIGITSNSIRQKIVVILVFVGVLYYISSLTPKIFGKDVKLVLEQRLTSLEADLSEKKDRVRSLEKILDIKESQALESKKKDEEQMKKLESNTDEISQLNNKLSKAEEEIRSIKSLTTGHASAININKRFNKKIYSKETPEYQKVVYRASKIDTDLNDYIVMVSIANGNSYGGERKFEDFLKVVEGIEFDKKKSTLGLLIGSKDEFRTVQQVLDKIDREDFFSRVILVQSEFIESLNKVDRDTRHQLAFQKERRRAISRARNFLISTTLRDESYALCLDSDMIEIPSQSLKLFIDSGKDIIVPRIRQGGAENYDFNSWKGGRIEPTEEESIKLDANDPEFVFVPRPDAGTAHMHDLYNDEKFGDLNKEDLSFAVEIDSVGGAILFVKCEIFKQGVTFPPYYIIGTKWGRFEGYDGIETEGICYQARTIGYKCWGMPNLVGWHYEDIEKA